MERSEPIRGATWDDFDAVVELLAGQSRAATGAAAVRAEFVRADPGGGARARPRCAH